LSAAPRRARLWPLALLPAALLLQWLAGFAPSVVEVVYANGIYRGVRWAHALLTGWIPFSIAEGITDVFLAGLIGYLAARLRPRALRAYWRSPGLGGRLGRLAVRTAAAAGAVYLAFLLSWGLNYRRQPVAEMLGLDRGGGTTEELRALSAQWIDAANALRAGLAEDEAGALRLRAGRRAALDAAHEGLQRASARLRVLAGPRVRPKGTLFSPLLARAGISGIFIPFTGEAHVNSTLPDVDLPFAASHELAHQRGLAREDEANYAASLACRAHPDPDFRYAGALVTSLYVQSALARADRAAALELEKARSAGVRRDQRALSEWSRRYRSRLSAVASRVNDTYLRSQGQVLGARSYGAMVDLLLAERRGQQ
jgi:hypothetical protein